MSNHSNAHSEIGMLRSRLAAAGEAWRIHQGAERDMLNGRPTEDALDEQSDARATLDALLGPEIPNYKET